MRNPIVLTACGFVDETGYGGSRSATLWERPPERLRWRLFSRTPFEWFGRMDALSKQAAVAVELLGLPFLDQGKRRPEMAISLGTEHGSLGVDLEFLQTIGQPGGASPLLFSYTLPSIAIGEIAIRHRILGPNVCFMSGPDSGLLAVWEGVRLVEDGEAMSCVCIGSDAFGSGSQLPPGAYAYAFLVEQEAEAERHRRTALANIRIGPTAPERRGEPQTGPFSRTALRHLYQFATAGDAEGEDTLSLPAPAALRVSQVLTVLRRRGTPPNRRLPCKSSRRSHGRTG
jgi:hypothetical protein